MTLLRSSRIVQARYLHASAKVQRGVAIGGGGGGGGGSTQASRVAIGSPFASLRRQMEDATPKRKAPAIPETSAQARQEVIKNDVQGGNLASQPTTSAEARREAIAVGAQSEARRPPTVPAQPRHKEQQTAMPNRRPVTSSDARKQVIQQNPELRTSQAQQHGGVASSPRRHSNSKGVIDSIPRWSVGVRSGLQRTFQFKADTLRSRMFLQGASSMLLLEEGWAGAVNLKRSTNGSESVEVLLMGSVEKGEERASGASMSISEHDVTIAESLDALYGNAASQSKQDGMASKSIAFTSSAATETAHTSSSVLEEERAEPNERIDERVPFNVEDDATMANRRRSEGEDPTLSALGAGVGRSSSSPIEEHVPVPNLHQQPRREFATLMGRTGVARSGSAGIVSIMASRAAAGVLNRTSVSSSSSVSHHNRWHATWSAAGSVTSSQKVWSDLVGRAQKNKALRIDDFIPVEIDAAQMGKRRSVSA